MIGKLLRKNISISQIIGYALATFTGLAIIITAIKFYGDIGKALRGDSDNKISANQYMVVSTPVSIFDTFGFGGTQNGIPEKEIESLAKQPWVEDVGKFTAANFSITAGVELVGKGMWSHLFLESVPDRFIDNIPSNWSFHADNPFEAEIPIIIPRQYLALYNFGYAPSRGLPQLNDGLVKSIPVSLYFNGAGYSDTFKGRIVGFSDRLNTIAVPQEFIDWANRRYSASDGAQPSRLILNVKDPGNPNIGKYLRKHGLEAAKDDDQSGRMLQMVRIVISIVVSIGAVICLLSLFILMLSINLLLQKNKEKNSTLILLGYSPWQIACQYFKIVAAINAVVLALSVAAMFIASALWMKQLGAMQLTPSSPLSPILWAIAITLAITAINFASIYSHCKRTSA